MMRKRSRRMLAGLCTAMLVAGLALVATATPAAAASDPGEAFGWGDNGNGKVGDGTTIDRSVPVAVCAPGDTAPCASVLDDAVQVAGGGQHSVAVLSDGSVYTWGDNAFGQLGVGNTTDSSVPVQVCAVGQSAPCGTFLDDVVSVSAGNFFSMALLSDGGIVTWGTNSDGQLGDGTTTARSVPVQVCAVGQSAPCAAFLDDAVAISAGSFHGLAIVSGGEVRAWGDNTGGRLGDNTTTSRSVPVAVCSAAACSGPLTGMTAVAGGSFHSMALATNGTVLAWGINSDGQLGNDTTTSSSTPVSVCTAAGCGGPLTGATQISGGDRSSHAVLADGTVRSWGDNPQGQLGDGTTTDKDLPVGVCAVGQTAPCANLLMGVDEISEGAGLHALARIDDSVVAWGVNSLGGALGDGTNTNSSVPVQVCAVGQTAPCTQFLDLVGTIATGSIHSLAVRVTPPPPADEADLAVSLSAAAVFLQSKIDYTVGVTNNGPDALTSATVVTAVPSTTTSVANLGPCSYNNTLKQVSCPVGALANSASTNFTFRATISLLSVGLPLHAGAQRTASSPNDPNPANDFDPANCAVITGLIILC